jgi:hypothetical protein
MVEPLAGRHFTWPPPNRSGSQFAAAMERLAQQYPLARTIHLVVDNVSMHSLKILVDHFGPERGAALWQRFTVHYTPKHASWLNQAEIEISLLARQCLGKRRIPSLNFLTAECRAWNRRINPIESPYIGNSPVATPTAPSTINPISLCGHGTRCSLACFDFLPVAEWVGSWMNAFQEDVCVE